MRNQDTSMLDAQTFSALPPQRQIEIAAELYERRDFEAIEALGVKIVTLEEIANEPPDAIPVTSLN
jgi:ribosomal protein L18E